MSIVSNIQKNINKVSRALKAKGMMPLINNSQFYGDNGPITMYIVHYGQPYDRKDKDGNIIIKNDIVGQTCSKVELLNILVKILKEGASDG